AELLDEGAGNAVRRGALFVRNRSAVVEHDDDALRMRKLPDPAPTRRHEHRVDEHHRIDVHRDEIAGTDFRLPGLAGEDFFCEGHTHRGIIFRDGCYGLRAMGFFRPRYELSAWCRAHCSWLVVQSFSSRTDLFFCTHAAMRNPRSVPVDT